MKLRPEHIERLEKFLDRIQEDAYLELPSQIHESITEQMIERICKDLAPQKDCLVLDVGFGRGYAMGIFHEMGFRAIGITNNQEEIKACKNKEIDIRLMDQSFLEFQDDYFDLIWCRHTLEHSIFPYFTLAGFHRVLKPGGLIYVEVPAPDTSSRHEKNENHYSVLPLSGWTELVKRSGFQITSSLTIETRTVIGPDAYFSLTAKKCTRN